jgi:hypothetical protein
MSASPTPERLEMQAHEQRERIHRTTWELISKVDDAKHRLTLSYNVRRHFGITATISIAIGFLCGYAVAGMFIETS